MKKFISVKLVDGEPMTRGDYNKYRGWTIPADENPEDPGYLVKYEDDYISWCPKVYFDKHTLPIVGEKNTITQADVDNFIGSATANTLKVFGVEKSTILTVVLKNGFVMHETSSCVDPNNYNEQVGADVCMEKIKDRIWFLLGFLLQSGVDGFKAVK